MVVDGRRAPFPEYIHDFFIDKYGLKSLGDKNFAKLIAGTRQYSKPKNKYYDKRIELFAYISGSSDPMGFKVRRLMRV